LKYKATQPEKLNLSAARFNQNLENWKLKKAEQANLFFLQKKPQKCLVTNEFYSAFT